MKLLGKKINPKNLGIIGIIFGTLMIVGLIIYLYIKINTFQYVTNKDSSILPEKNKK